MREATSLMDRELIATNVDRIKSISKLLEEKSKGLKKLDDDILNIIPTEDIEEIIQNDEFNDNISETQKVMAAHSMYQLPNSQLKRKPLTLLILNRHQLFRGGGQLMKPHKHIIM